jgi:1-deoxy-D-xylulose-5-phosphate synthase
LQRAFDQVVHDVCIQNLPVIFAMDRAGLVGDDGRTHQGMFDISYLRILPNIVLMSPKDENEMQHMIYTAVNYGIGPIGVRYPRGAGFGVEMDAELKNLPIGKGEILRQGKDLALIAVGSEVYPAMEAASLLAQFGVEAEVINARFIKPLDEELLLGVAHRHNRIVTVEEAALPGGFGSAILELFEQKGIHNSNLHRIGVPDRFIDHGSQPLMRAKLCLDADGIVARIREYFPELASNLPVTITR